MYQYILLYFRINEKHHIIIFFRNPQFFIFFVQGTQTQYHFYNDYCSFRASCKHYNKNMSTLEGILLQENLQTAGPFESYPVDQSDITFSAVPPEISLKLQRKGNNNSFMAIIITEMESPGVSFACTFAKVCFFAC